MKRPGKCESGDRKGSWWRRRILGISIRSAVKMENENALQREKEHRLSRHMVLERNLGFQGLSKGNQWSCNNVWCLDILKIWIGSLGYTVRAWFSTLNKIVLCLGLCHNSKIWGVASDWLTGRSSQLGGRKTSFASFQTVEGSNSYSELKMLKSKG